MKTALVYASVHHGNTEKVVKAIAEKHPEKTLLSFIADNLPAHKKVFVIYTCGQDSSSYIKTAEELIKSKDASFAGYYSCSGYDTWGPFKLIGGKNKNHPDENDIKKAIQFYENLI